MTKLQISAFQNEILENYLSDMMLNLEVAFLLEQFTFKYESRSFWALYIEKNPLIF